MVSKLSKNAGESVCGIGPAFAVIGGKWKALLLCELRDRPLRYGELRRRLAGISEKMLAQQLREMERDELLLRVAYPEVPARVEYSLTSWGPGLSQALAPVADWGEAFSRVTGRYASA